MKVAEKEETTAPERSLVRKLAEVKGLVARIPKSGRNEFHRYDYATEADVVEAVRHGMAERRLVMFPSVEDVAFIDVASEKGKSQRLCTAKVVFTVEDGDSGETRSFKMVGQGMDQGDKAFYKAITGAEKYAVMKLFMMATGDDAEQDSPERHSAPGKAKASSAGPKISQKTGALAVEFGTFKGKLADALTVLQLAEVIGAGRGQLEKNPNAGWSGKLRANVEALQEALDGRLANQAAEAGAP